MKFRRSTIVVADDNRSVLTAVSLLLRPFFERIITLTSPVHMLPTVKAEKPCVVLLDMNFRSAVNNGNEGLYWLRRLREEIPTLPVVLFTAYAEIPLAVEAIKSGAADFVVKPWDNTALVDTLLRASEPTADSPAPKPKPKPKPEPEAEQLEKARIEQVITEVRGNLSRAAARLGISRQTLYNKMKRLGL